ncbi:EAL domain-containing protein [Oceanimonas sp. CHS3-5]|uniref:putative bifunctional diguanylate cyclase/phosphodiesterase n=1 Tax=Oceanimonas sp. CHS3-5 TaxID=3068186 RepID=UPI00273FC412|nr:EAL domain-containing protein [Oceanimonas sp. CHS3-5]MDP5292497.1 EAL domain-containing protein [Oceanimonas sp. CHS3-5]
MTAPVHADARILVLDDNPVNVELLLCLLEDEGYTRARGETDPRRLALHMREQAVDLLLLDIRMPHLDGYRVLEWLHTEWGERAPPVIVLSAQTDAETRLRALGLGARDFLNKPFDHLEVLQRIRNTLESHFLLRERSVRAACLEDEVRQRTSELQHQAISDPVTGRLNRRGLLERLQGRAGHDVVLYFVALDGLEDIARLHGLRVAETLSRTLSTRLQTLLPESHCVFGAWSSSEWLVLDFVPPRPDAIARLGDGLLHNLSQGIEVEQLLLHLDGRVGISHSDLAHDSAEHLIRQAAIALPPKAGEWRCFEPALEQRLLTLSYYRQALRTAAGQGELFLVYQPKVALHDERVVGAEALLRWISPEFGFVSPADFIPIAESSGDILRLGDWVIDTAIAQLEQWLEQKLVAPDFRVAVNVAALQLMQPGFADSLITRLAHSRLPPGAIEIEVTESGLMQNMELALVQLNQLAAAGIGIAIDDFGTGYSSLAYLKTMPVSVLKIDRAFVDGMDTDEQDRGLAQAVIHMARILGCDTVAEGVERPEHVELLKAMGCTQMQGYWYSPPLKPEAFVEYCQSQNG